ncbi:hypothetical protein evm_004134 [Chilo suppressalis]|nr:hypothetical protein evm_004134 [Chilo suppressalis]
MYHIVVWVWEHNHAPMFITNIFLLFNLERSFFAVGQFTLTLPHISVKGNEDADYLARTIVNSSISLPITNIPLPDSDILIQDEHNFEIMDLQLEHSYMGKEHFDHLLLFAAWWNHQKVYKYLNLHDVHSVSWIGKAVKQSDSLFRSAEENTA